MKLNKPVKSVCQFGASVILGLCGLTLIYSWPIIVDSFLTLRPNSLLYNYWSKIPVDIATDFYFFNWTNSEEVYNVSVKPRFEQIGPYRFWQKEQKTNITWNSNGTVSFRQQKFWHYDENPKNGNLKDIVTTADALTLTAGYVLRNWNYYIRKAVFVTLSQRFPTITRSQTVGELLFDGYQEPLIKIARSLPFFSDLNLPDWDKFGWLYARNGSTEFDGVFNMGTGENSMLGKVYKWNYQKRTPYFDGSCADVYGSGGQLFPRNLNKDFTSMFSSDLRRSSQLKFEKEEIVNNILGYKYIVDEIVLDNGTLSPENSCFCNGACVPSGMVNLSNTRHGSPLFISLPHFYMADPYYINSVDGLKPDETKHKFSLVVEPMSGIPLKADVKIQVNLLVQPVSGISLFENAPKFFVPVLWTAQTYEVQGFHAFLIRLLTNVSTICVTLGTIMLITSAVLMFILIYTNYKHCKKGKVTKIQFLETQHIPLNINSNELDEYK